jgi:tripartite-type tricarboxylate transporter receptor subunit TctC
MNVRAMSVALAAAAAFTVLPLTAHAEYPDHPIRYVLHVSPGGATDVMARKLGVELQKVMGQPFVIENRPGGRGAAQMVELSHSKPDGYTIGSVTSSHLSAFHMTLKQYNVGSLTWIAKLVSEPYVFVVRKDNPIKDMKGLIEAIKAKSGKVVIAGFTRGSGSHIAWEMLMHAAKLPDKSVNWVPYDSVRGGVIAVLGGHGLATVAYVGLVEDQVAAGNLRVIGGMADTRVEPLPDVKTLKEQGIDVPTSWTQWRGVVGPKNMPEAVKNKLAAAIEKAMNDDEMKKFVRNDSLVYDVQGPAEFTKFVKEQDTITEDWLKRLGFIKK